VDSSDSSRVLPAAYRQTKILDRARFISIVILGEVLDFSRLSRVGGTVPKADSSFWFQRQPAAKVAELERAA